MNKEKIARVIIFTIIWTSLGAIATALIVIAVSSIGCCFSTTFNEGCLTAPIVGWVEEMAEKAAIYAVLIVSNTTPYIVKFLIGVVATVLLLVLVWAVCKVFFARAKNTNNDNLPDVGEIDH